MARIVGVHGIGKQSMGESSLLAEWWPAMADGLRRAGAADGLDASDGTMAFYGDLFRPAGEWLAVGDPRYTAAEVEDGFERDLLAQWWRPASERDANLPGPQSASVTLASAPRSVQAALRALSGSRFFAGIALRAMVFDLKHVHRYLVEAELRERARTRVREAIGPDTRVVAHSLGSVVAYEALCTLPGHPVRALVTPARAGRPADHGRVRRRWRGPTWPTTETWWPW
ncbi:hypothetical protein [Streptomyces sp. NPDC058486]|uniref:hypothetical protein n=1 Tax=unclassified Streptomyces TaxID=2593676 RepID=UPI00364B1492